LIQLHFVNYKKGFNASVDYARSNSSPKSFDQSQISTLALKIDSIEEQISSVNAKLDLIFQALKPQNEE
jgi:hypothetical protein